MKKCSKCDKEKSENNFYFKITENRLNSWCKQCVYKLQKQRWIDRKIKAVELMGGKCSKCGYDKNIAALGFHHLDPKTKEAEWGRMRLLNWKKTVEELKKCILICSNCHIELHNPQSLDKTFSELDNLSLNSAGPSSTGICPHCSKPVYGTKYCSAQCVHFSNRKVARPSKKTLKEKIATMNWLAIGREYKVSDNAVRKWAKGYGLI